MRQKELEEVLNQYSDTYNRPDFIDNDPILIPHRFSKPQDIEIAGFFAAMLAWGRRDIIIRNVNKIIAFMDDAPYDFILNHEEEDRKRFLHFVHRTFQPDDMLYFIHFLHWFYGHNDSLENAFIPEKGARGMTERLVHFKDVFFSQEHLPRTRKHVQSPANKSACKRLCLYLRWMVRPADTGVDFGIWKQIQSSELILPVDVHVHRTAKALKLTKSKMPNWKVAEEITKKVGKFCPQDPCKYDFALFGMSLEGLV